MDHRRVMVLGGLAVETSPLSTDQLHHEITACSSPPTVDRNSGFLPCALPVMTSKALSPAAALIRGSRLVAMPTPLPPLQSNSVYAEGPSPFPLNQAISTPLASAHRGEWGLKRDLPLRTSRSLRHIRYNDLDTLDHMTTFESAHDEVYNLKKWQEMGLALHRATTLLEDDQALSTLNEPPVFDQENQPEGYKWRYQGPHLRSLSKKQLKTYIDKVVKPKEKQFYDFVARRQAMDELRKDYNIEGITKTDAELEAEVRKMGPLKVDFMALSASSVGIENLIHKFLDLPHRSPPMATHPSAGLYYVRSNAHAVNDPILGPQATKQPVKGRDVGFNQAGSLAAVGGVIASAHRKVSAKRMHLDRTAVREYIPKRAKISPQGRILFDVDVDMPEESGPSKLMKYTDTRRSWRGFDRTMPERSEEGSDKDSIMNMLRARLIEKRGYRS